MSAENTTEDLSKLKLTELKALCKTKSLPVSGTKSELIQRLTGGTAPSTSKKNPVAPKKDPTFNAQVLKTFEPKRNPMVIKRNIWGNFEHSDTNLVFSLDKKVIGKQGREGHILELSFQDLENIEKFHFELDPSTKIMENKLDVVLTDSVKEQERIDELRELVQEN